MHDYSELKVRIERGEGDTFRVAAAGPSGEATGTFQVPISQLELENLVLRISRPRATVRRIDSPEMELVRRFGNELFDSIFQSRVRDVYRDSYAQARAEGKGLRITLALADAPDLMNLPWEYLYDDPSFLSISTWTPVVRYLNLPRARKPLPVTTPLRILAMVSAPTDAVTLDVERERSLLEEALEGLVVSGGVEVTWLEEATLRALQRALRRGPYHVFHFIGHGGYDHAAEDGVLLLEDEQGRGRIVSGAQLGTMLADHTTLRLAVLNACEGARTSVEDPFAGVAASLVQREIPAVIAMQFEITDRAAIVFAGEFYSALADGYPVDSAVAEARKAIFADANDIEWGTPVLFMRVPDGRIFDVTHEPAPQPAVAVAEAAAPQAEPESEPEPEPEPAAEPAPAVAEVEAAAPEPEPAVEPEPEPEPARAEAVPVPVAPVPQAVEEPPVALPVPPPRADRSTGRGLRSRALVVGLALAGAVVGFIANGFPHIEGQKDMVELAILAPETVGVQILIAAVAGLVAFGRVREPVAHGLLLGFGLLSAAGAIGLSVVAVDLGGKAGLGPDLLLVGGVLVLAAAIVGIVSDRGALKGRQAPTPFRWVRATILAASGAAVGFVALFVPLGTLAETSKSASLVDYGGYGLSGSAIEPVVAIVAAACVAYAFGRGYRRLLAAGAALALGAQTALYYGSWLAGIANEEYFKPDPGPGCFVGFASAALLIAAGLVGRRD